MKEKLRQVLIVGNADIVNALTQTVLASGMPARRPWANAGMAVERAKALIASPATT